MNFLIRDARVAARLLWKDSAFTFAAVLTLAVCIGVNVGLFSVVRRVVLQPLAVPEPDRLVIMGNQNPKASSYPGLNSGVPEYFDRLGQTSAFEEQALFPAGNQTEPSRRHHPPALQAPVSPATQRVRTPAP